MTLMVTGHRQLTPEGWTGNPWPERNPKIQEWHNKIVNVIHNYVKNYAMITLSLRPDSPTDFITGMALGADQLFAKAVLLLNNENIPYNLHAAVPFKGQDGNWPQHSKNEYKSIIERCNSITEVCDHGYAAWKMQARNQWMVDRATNVLAVWDGTEKGGTYNCLQAALKEGRRIDQLNPKNLKITKIS